MSGWSKEQGFSPCFCSVMHTFGSTLNFHPHIHMLYAGGGLSVDEKLIEIDYIPYQVLKNRFRAILVKMLRIYVKEQIIAIPRSVVHIWKKKKGVSTFGAMLCSLFSVTWYVYVGERLKNSDYTIKYIGRYAKRPSMSEAKILYYDGSSVLFQYKDKIRKECTTLNLSVEEFIGRLIRHIPDKYFKMIRYYGIYSNRNNEKYVKLKKLVSDKYGGGFRFCGKIARNWRERVIESTGEDPMVCPYCHEVMVLTKVAYRSRDGTLVVKVC